MSDPLPPCPMCEGTPGHKLGCPVADYMREWTYELEAGMSWAHDQADKERARVAYLERLVERLSRRWSAEELTAISGTIPGTDDDGGKP